MIYLQYEEQNIVQNQYPYKQLLIGNVFMCIKYAWQQYINLRQLTANLIHQIPNELRSYSITHQQFILGQSYSFDKLAFEMLCLSIRMVVNCICIMTNVLPYIWNNVDRIFPMLDMNSEFQRAIGFIAIQGFMNRALDVPLSAYGTFIIEKKYNFTNKTLQIFIYDIFVDGILFAIITPPIIYGYLRVVEIGQQYFYIYMQVFALTVTVILTWIYPNFIAPLFNQFTQIDQPRLRIPIHNLTDRCKIPVTKILRMQETVRSGHCNAYFYGLGSQKTIVLYNTLIEKLTPQQIMGVITHQLGHCIHNHAVKKLILYLIEVFCLFYIFSIFLMGDEVFTSFGFQQKSTFICTVLFFHLFEPLTYGFNILLLMLTRKFQFQADAYACKQGYGEQLKSSLIKLFEESTATVKPDILYAWVKYSHPNIHERISYINLLLHEQKQF